MGLGQAQNLSRTAGETFLRSRENPAELAGIGVTRHHEPTPETTGDLGFYAQEQVSAKAFR